MRWCVTCSAQYTQPEVSILFQTMMINWIAKWIESSSFRSAGQPDLNIRYIDSKHEVNLHYKSVSVHSICLIHQTYYQWIYFVQLKDLSVFFFFFGTSPYSLVPSEPTNINSVSFWKSCRKKNLNFHSSNPWAVFLLYKFP